jgi:hypothetical protein
MSEQPPDPDFTDFPDARVTGPDPGEALDPGTATDLPHRARDLVPGDPDYVAPADVPEIEDAGGKHL